MAEMFEPTPRLWLKCFSSLVVAISIFYLMIAPSLQLKNLPFIGEKVEMSQRELAKLDLEKKVYPEIQARINESNEWLFRKFTLAGSLVGIFLLQMWPFLNPVKEIKRRTLPDLLMSPLTCAVLGLACIIALFIDLHSRNDILVIQELGSWAAYYGAPAISGGTVSITPEFKGFLSWEQFIRTPPPNSGMQQSLNSALQTGSLNFITIILFTLYYLSFLEVCCRYKLDRLNIIINLLALSTLLIFAYEAHSTSGNFEFLDYGYGPLFSSFLCYLVGWIIVCIAFGGWGIYATNGEAVKWLRKSAEQGNARAQNNLGMMYFKGRGVRRSPAKAMKWWRKAAEQGDALAQNNLGVMYAEGEGVPRDAAEAEKWFHKAAEQGFATAQENLDEMHESPGGHPPFNAS